MCVLALSGFFFLTNSYISGGDCHSLDPSRGGTLGSAMENNGQSLGPQGYVF